MLTGLFVMEPRNEAVMSSAGVATALEASSTADADMGRLVSTCGCVERLVFWLKMAQQKAAGCRAGRVLKM